LRSIEFDNHAEAAAHVNVVTDAALWKVSEDTETSAIIENILDDVVPVVTANVPNDANLYAVSVNRANMRNEPSTRNGVIAKLERGIAVQLLPSSSGSWVKLHVVETKRVGWISKKLFKKAD
jgi:SH3-like domain-containing protein